MWVPIYTLNGVCNDVKPTALYTLYKVTLERQKDYRHTADFAQIFPDAPPVGSVL